MAGQMRLNPPVCVYLLLMFVSMELVTSSPYVPGKMMDYIKSLKQHYRVSDKLKHNGVPVFPEGLLTSRFEEAEKKILMEEVLHVYAQLIKGMLRHADNHTSVSARNGATSMEPSVGDKLSYLLGRVEELQKHHYPHHTLVKRQLHALWNIQINNSTVQSKALGELTRLYSEASRLTNDISSRMQICRRRRQAQQARTPLKNGSGRHKAA